MNHVKFFSSFAIVFFLFMTNAQAFSTAEDTVIVPPRMLHPTDSIEVTMSGSTKYLKHIVKPKQTLYGISKYYGQDVSDLLYANSNLKGGVELGQTLRIPIGGRDIKWQKSDKNIKWRMVEVVYIVKPKDTVFKIAKTYFKMPIERFLEMNSIEDNTLEIGDKVIVGWIDIDGLKTKTGVRAWLPLSLYSSYKKLKSIYIKNANNSRKKEVKEKGAAAWNRKSKSDDLYALHKTAAIGTILKVTNPLNNRSIYVKVVGRMQSAGYKYDTLLVLSPAAAKALGGVNRTFRVSTTYYK